MAAQGWSAKGRSRDKFLSEDILFQEQENNVNQFPLLSVNLLMTIYNSGISSLGSKGAFFLFLVYYVANWVLKTTGSLLSGEGCQQHLSIVVVRAWGDLKFYFHNKMCINFHAFGPIWWLIFVINSTSPMQLAGQMKSVAETWHIQEVTVIWGN